DYREGAPVQADCVSNDPLIRSEISLPARIAHNCYRVRAGGLIFVSEKCAAIERLQAEGVKVVAAHHLGDKLLRLASRRRIRYSGEVVREDLLEDIVLVAIVDVVVMRGREIALVLHIGGEDGHQSGGVLDRQRRKQERVEKAEDCGVGSDS